MRSFAAAVAAVTAVGLSGCGTICNLLGDHPVKYGGVVRTLSTSSDAFHSLRPDGVVTAIIGVALVGTCTLADVSASVVGDTLTLPLLPYLRGPDPFVHGDALSCVQAVDDASASEAAVPAPAAACLEAPEPPR